MLLADAARLGSSLVNVVKPHVSRVEVAGSVRREKPNVKDIELVAIVSDYAGLYASLATTGRFIKPGVPDVVDWPPKVGAKYVRMLLNEDVKLDLFIANQDNWGSLLCMRTGSAVGPDGGTFSGFIPAMFSRWKRVSGGGKMSGCLPTMPDGTQLSVPEERDFFELLNVRWVEPRDRVSNKAVKPLK